MDDKHSRIHKENLAKEFRSAEVWKARYGHKFQVSEIRVDKDEGPDKSYTRDFRKVYQPDDSATDSESEDEDEIVDDQELQTGLTGRFSGFYLPDTKKTFTTTNKETQLLKTKKDVVPQEKITEERYKNHRKKDWMKHYFEESSKAKLIEKAKKSGGS